jgi:hypothetical protein
MVGHLVDSQESKVESQESKVEIESQPSFVFNDIPGLLLLFELPCVIFGGRKEHSVMFNRACQIYCPHTVPRSAAD